jgi:hypothetical protein
MSEKNYEYQEVVNNIVKSCKESGNWANGYMLLGRWQEDLKTLNLNNQKKIWFVNEPLTQVKAMIFLWKILPEKPTWLRPYELIKLKKMYKGA